MPVPVVADRPRARAGAWYEMVPRSQGTVPGRHGTFDDCIARLPEIAALGFDVRLSHADPSDRHDQPQGPQQRAARPRPTIPAAPMPSAAREGGHDAVHPELGTLDDFRRFVEACREPRHGGRARLRDPVLARPSLADTSIRNGSSAGPTARSDTPRTRRRNTRTSSIRISIAPTASRCGRRCATSCCSGSSRASASSASTIRTPSRSRSGNG